MTEQAVSLDSSAKAIEFATEVLRGQFEEVFRRREAALESKNIEGVHEMRVAIRRLRSALRDFSAFLKKRPLRESKKDLKRLADALGEARDLDVEIAKLEKLQAKAEHENIRAALGKRIEKRRAKREAKQAALIETLSPLAIEPVRERFLKALGETVEKSGKANDLTARQIGREVISNGVREFCDLSDSLYEPFNCKKHHELRIAAKRLRYGIELFTVCFGEPIEPFAESIADMQTHLGELHDRDLWIEKLSRRLNKSKGKNRRADFWLLSRFVKERTKHYRAALRLWSKWQKHDFIENLQAVLELDIQSDTGDTKKC
jgi:CHAD domain-containing protein